MSGKKKDQHWANFARVCGKIVEIAGADLLLGCEIGGFQQGPSRAGVDVRSYLRSPFGEVGVAEVDNYLSVWGFGGADQPVVSQHKDATIQKLPGPGGRDVRAGA